MRRLWVCGLILLAACAGTPNTQATQTRTSEVATNTALAGVLPTQNAAVPPTPVPTPNAGPTPNGVATLTAVVAATRGTTSQVPTDTYHFDAPAISTLAPFTPTRLSPSPSVIGGSWVAYSPMTHIRFFAPPSLVEDRQFNSNHRYSLASPSNIYDFEALDIYRFVGARGGDFARTWQAEMDTFQKGNNVGPLSVTSGPQQQQVAAYQGNVGQFHYNQ